MPLKVAWFSAIFTYDDNFIVVGLKENMHTNVMENCYKFPSWNVDIEIVISLPYKRDWKMGVNVWFPFMLVLLEF